MFGQQSVDLARALNRHRVSGVRNLDVARAGNARGEGAAVLRQRDGVVPRRQHQCRNASQVAQARAGVEA